MQVILEHCSGAKPLSCPPNAADAVGLEAGTYDTKESVVNCAVGSSGELINGLLKPTVSDRWTLTQVSEHAFLSNFTLEDDALSELTPPWIPGVNQSIVDDPCVEFSNVTNHHTITFNNFQYICKVFFL